MSERKKLMFEDYVSFLEDGQDVRNLSMDQLNQLIRMHGFSPLRTKYEYMYAFKLKAVAMMGPTRSTVGEGCHVYPCSRLTVEEVQADVRSLGWDECPLGSILAVGSSDDDEMNNNKKKNQLDVASSSVSRSIIPATGWNGKRRRSNRTARRMRRMIEIMDG